MLLPWVAQFTFCFQIERFHLLYLWTAVIFFCSTLNSVLSQCTSGFEAACTWTHDPSSPLKWAGKNDAAGRWVELTNCKTPNCGIAVIVSPWLPAKDSETSVRLDYKVYGYSEVYVRLFLVNEQTKQQLFSKQGNYGDAYPEKWSSSTVTVPRTAARYQLMLKAYTPYKEALLAVKDIKLSGSLPPPTSAPQAEKERERESEQYEREEMSQALKDNFIRKQDLQLGFTAVVDPEICRY